MSAHHLDEQADDTLHDEGITLGLEVHQSLRIVGLQPHTALASLNQVLFGLVLLIQWGLVVAQVDEQLVTVHPVVQFAELFDDFVLQFVDGLHCSCLILRYK